MANEIPRYLIPANGPEVEPIKTAIALLQRLCKESDTPKDALLLVPNKNRLEGTPLEKTLGTTILKDLLKGEPVQLPGGGNLRLESQQTFHGSVTATIIMSIYVTKKMLDQIDNTINVTAVIIVPWSMQEVEEWMRTWNPHVLGEPPTETENFIDNPVVEEALKALTNRVNLGTGLLDSRDKAAAICIFRLLHKSGVPWDPNSVRAWALRNGWTPKGADQLKEAAQGVLLGKRFRVSCSGVWSSDIMELLRQRAQPK